MDIETQVIRIQRDDPWLNGYNPWLALALRTNHDIQYLHTQDHSLAIMYYILKYISKSEQSLYSKLAIAAAVRTSQVSSNSANSIMAKTMLTQIYNKIQSHREVGTPEAISHLLEFTDHYTDEIFVLISTTQLWQYFDSVVARPVITSLSHDNDDDVDVTGEFNGEIIMEDTRYYFITFFDDYQY
jgi:hypothetical protein